MNSCFMLKHISSLGLSGLFPMLVAECMSVMLYIITYCLDVIYSVLVEFAFRIFCQLTIVILNCSAIKAASKELERIDNVFYTYANGTSGLIE